MELKKLISIVDMAYPDGLVLRAFESGKPVGDSLAEFIARELKDTFDEKVSSLEQIEEARRVLGKGYFELGEVLRVLSP